MGLRGVLFQSLFLGGGFFSKSDAVSQMKQGSSPSEIRRRCCPAHACPVEVAVVGRGWRDGRRRRGVGLFPVAVLAVLSLGVGGVHVRRGVVVVVGVFGVTLLVIGPLSFPAGVLVDSPLVEA
jgi:hypothetical protein